MSKLLDLLQRISDGTPAPLGFGAARRAGLPGLALVGLATKDHEAGLAASASAGLDGILVSGVDGSAGISGVAGSADGVPWGAFAPALSGETARACQENGADVLAFGLESPAAGLAGEDDMARMISLAPDLSDRELRAVSALPVDCFIVDMGSVSGPWTLQDLVTVGSISRRTDKQVLVLVSAAPAAQELEAIRDMGASGLILDLANVSTEDLASLKTALQDMPRPRRRRDRVRATVPSTGFASEPAPSREDDDHDDDYDDE